jgi:hypothetical protein
MTSRRRWLIVAIGVLVLALTPYAVSRLPAGHSAISASALLSRITASADVPYSGYAEAHGSLSLPDTDEFGSLAELLGGPTDLRIWWRASKDWRVDAVALNGENDVHQDAQGIWTWDYEQNRATRTDYVLTPEARLPRSDDLAPASLARRLLDQATAGEVSRLPDQRIAGHDAAGLRLRPDQPTSTISRVDVWAVPSSGLPVRVAAYGRSGSVVLSAAMLDLSTATPTGSDTAFAPPAEATVRHDSYPDLVSALDRYVDTTPPIRLAGLNRSGSATVMNSVGLYGRGVTAMVAVPLPPRLADALRGQLVSSGVNVADDAATTIAFGPLTLRLTARALNGSRWLLAGTVTKATLALAETQLPTVAEFGR